MIALRDFNYISILYIDRENSNTIEHHKPSDSATDILYPTRFYRVETEQCY